MIVQCTEADIANRASIKANKVAKRLSTKRSPQMSRLIQNESSIASPFCKNLPFRKLRMSVGSFDQLNKDYCDALLIVTTMESRLVEFTGKVSVLYGRSSVAAPSRAVESFKAERGGHEGPPVQD